MTDAPPAVCPVSGEPSRWVPVHVIRRKGDDHLSPLLWMCWYCGVEVEPKDEPKPHDHPSNYPKESAHGA